MSVPTDEQILHVKNNIRNIINFNNYLYNQGNVKILNAYLLLSLTDNKDLGEQISINLIKGSFIGIGAEFSIPGAIVSNFVCGIVDYYTDNTPASLNMPIDSLLNRYQATSEQLNVDLEMYYGDPVSYWNKTFSGTASNAFGTYPYNMTFNQLDTIDFPADTDSAFMDYVYAAQYALDQQIWFTLLPNFVITKYEPETDYPCKTYSEQEMENNAAWFYGVNKSYWNNWTYVHETNRKGEDISYYQLFQNNIGTGAGAFTDGHISDGACDYLFIDSYDNVIINANGLFHRNFVFNNMPNIKHVIHIYNN